MVSGARTETRDRQPPHTTICLARRAGVDYVEFVSVRRYVFQRIRPDERKWIMRLRHNIHPHDLIEPCAVVSDRCPTRATEQIKQSHDSNSTRHVYAPWPEQDHRRVVQHIQNYLHWPCQNANVPVLSVCLSIQRKNEFEIQAIRNNDQRMVVFFDRLYLTSRHHLAQ